MDTLKAHLIKKIELLRTAVMLGDMEAVTNIVTGLYLKGYQDGVEFSVKNLDATLERQALSER